ncbi:MAG: CCA tRNA nucleotidyltransferase, partial [Chloroflexi bacterium]|nr:CCA tRNA nucleotidyltransferase [Chloroflexota bacterium]
MTRNLAGLLEKSLDSTRLDLIHRVADESSALGFSLYIVGGFVRDLVLGRDGADFDLVVEGDAIRLARALVSKYGGKVAVHDKFGTAKWDIRESGIVNRGSASDSRLPTPDFLDLISSRSETYANPAALPTVKMGSLADDIRRRDFTINTLALRLDGDHFGELRDDLGGLADLQKGVVRVLHPRSFIDDPTRMYRAVRYEQRHGFTIAKETLDLIPEAWPLVEKLSAQRIRHELDLI